MDTHKTEHPFWAIIRKANAGTGCGPLEYEPFPLPWNAEPRHRFQNRVILGVSFDALCLVRVLDGDPPGLLETFDINRHREAFHFISATPFGTAIGWMAGEACRSVLFMPVLSESMRLADFPLVTLQWIEFHRLFLKRPADSEEWEGMLASHLIDGGNDREAFDYYFKETLNMAPDAKTFADEYRSRATRQRSAAYKKKKRDNNPMQNRFKDRLISHWMPAALWCRSSAGILKIIEPDSPMKCEDVKALETDMSRLGLLRVRNPDHEARINIAEDEFQKWLDSQASP